MLKNKFYGNKTIHSKNIQQIGQQTESEKFAREFLKSNQEYIPAIDYLTASNFAHFGLAELYYQDVISRIYRTYPYDGAISEHHEWLNDSTPMDRFFLENVYPRTNGYITLGDNWGTQQFLSQGYGSPPSASYEYIQTYGGPHLGFDVSGKRETLIKNNLYENSNKWNASEKQKTNLEFNVTGSYSGSDNGVTIEFWLKKTEFNQNKTPKEVIFDLWNRETYGTSQYGRLRLETNATASSSCFRLTCLSGTTGVSNIEIGSSTDTNLVANGNWNHYALSIATVGSDLQAKLYVNAKLDDTYTATSQAIQEVTGAMVSNIGALVATPENLLGPVLGHGKMLSSSLDEFRFWKIRRTAEEIGKFYNVRVGGGNNDISNNTTKLGFYYKFNEGITQTSSVDSVVLDYSGRISNGSWTGYDVALNPRSTGSAIVEASASNSEFKDPIIYSFHPDVQNVEYNFVQSGSAYDIDNGNALWFTYPQWIIEDDTIKGNGEQKKQTQIIASSFDSLYQKVENINKIKNIQYISDKSNQIPFIKQLLTDLGLDTPDILSEIDVCEYFLNKDENGLYEEKVEEIKRVIYQNIYNNLIYIFKQKGTEEAYRNLLRCFGVDRDLISFNMYSDGEVFEFKDNFYQSDRASRVINFYDADSFSATIYQATASNDSDNYKSLISASSIPEKNDFIPFTLEGEFLFPRQTKQSDDGNYIYVPFLSSSLFGCHNALGTDQGDYTWQLPETGSLQIFCVKERNESPNAKFVLSGTIGSNFPVLTSSFFPQVYDDDRWNISVSVRHSKYPLSNRIVGSSGSTEGEYILEFYGVNFVQDIIPKLNGQKKEFYLTSSQTYEQGSNFLRSDKRVYAGAHRTNFTGSTLTQTDVKIINVKTWLNYLPTSSIQNHAKYEENKSIENPYYDFGSNNLYFKNQNIFNQETLLFDWSFSANTGTNDLGQFYIYDEVSGSNELAQEKFAEFGRVRLNYPAKGDFFPSESTSSLQEKYLGKLKRKTPEILNSSDMIEIKQRDYEVYSKSSRPSKYIFSFEKSLSNTISQDILTWFDTILDFNNIIGHPVHKYRPDYKPLEKIRELYFQNIQNEPDIEKFLNFYKWLDTSILYLLKQLTPASAKLSDNWNVIESHILERNKYQHKFPLLEIKTSTSGTISSERLNWLAEKSPQNQNEEESGLWWKYASLNDTNLWQSDRNNIASVMQSQKSRIENRPQTHKFDKLQEIKGGQNQEGRNGIVIREYLKPYAGYAGSYASNYATIKPSDVEKLRSEQNTDLEDNLLYKNKKYKFNVSTFDEILSGNQDIAPFTLVSSSVKTGYNNQIVTALSKSIQLTNLHNDYDLELPLQGTFPTTHVGGFQWRNVAINSVSDSRSTRPEKFGVVYDEIQLSITTPNPYNSQTDPIALWTRDGYTKRPLNAANIKSTTSSNVLGNFFNNYEVVQTAGRNINNVWFRESQGVLPNQATSSFVSGLVEFEVPDRELTGSKSIFVNRFSSPGSIETSTPAYLDLFAGELSIYNSLVWRNKGLRDALDQFNASASLQFGIDGNLTASYHKTNRNIRYRIEKSGSTFITGTLYDNKFIQHAIPQSDLQYSWINYAAVSASNLAIDNTNLPFSFDRSSFVDKIAKNIKYNSFSSSYLFEHDDSYGWSTWRQIRLTDTSSNVYNRENNIISVVDNINQPQTVYQYVESPINQSNYAIIHRFLYNSETPIEMKYEHDNMFDGYCRNEINEKINFEEKEKRSKYKDVKKYYIDKNNNVDMRQVSQNYKKQLFPSDINQNLKQIRYRTEYSESSGYGLRGFDRNINDRRTFWPPSIERTSITGSTPFKNAVNYQYGRSVYPFGNNILWYPVTDVPGVTYQYIMAYGRDMSGSFQGELNPSSFSTDTVDIFYVDPNTLGLFGAGQSYHSGTTTSDQIDSYYFNNPTASLQYVYAPILGKKVEPNWVYAVHEQAGRGAWYKDYDEYASDIYVHSKGHSIIPEFNISSYMDEYQETNNFKQENKKYLKLDGGLYSSSADSLSSSYIQQFFDKYTDTTVMSNFFDILKEHRSYKHDISKMTLKCHGVKKLLPYNGFYPTIRTAQLGTLFSQSVAPFISGTFYDVPASQSLALQSLLQPYFSPGIVFNTIKSGIAVDWPIITGSSTKAEIDAHYQTIKGDATGEAYDAFSLYISSSAQEADFNGGVNDWREYLLTSSFDNFGGFTGKYHSRIPFESLIDLRRGLLSGTNTYLVAPDKILQSSGSADTRYPYFNWYGKKKPHFERAMHNFLSEVPKFFLEEEKLTYFSSAPEKDFKPMKAGTTYTMDVVLKKTDDMFMVKSYYSSSFFSGSSGQYDIPYSYNGRYFGPPAQSRAVLPFVAGNTWDSRAYSYADPSYAPYTPPYFYQDAKITIQFTPTETRKYTIDEIMAGAVSASSPAPFEFGQESTDIFFAQNNAMSIDASVNLFLKGNTLQAPDTTGYDSWHISTKFETPVLSFNQTSSYIGTSYQGFPVDSPPLPQGMWGTYGQIPSGSQGIYLEIKESNPTLVNNTLSGSETTGSLIDICRFKSGEKRIGKVAQKKIIEEAIVAIPYYNREKDNTTNIQGKYFIKLRNQEEEGVNSATIMKRKMKKYYFPPFMDFSKDNKIHPFAMYIFEFSEELNQQDLVDIWQGVLPRTAMRATEEDAIQSHPMGEMEMLSVQDVEEDIQWLVFKVKKRAGSNYYDLIPGQDIGSDILKDLEQVEFDYNYNWPYDYCSLVELAKIDIEYEITKDKDR